MAFHHCVEPVESAGKRAFPRPASGASRVCVAKPELGNERYERTKKDTHGFACLLMFGFCLNLYQDFLGYRLDGL